MNQAIAGLVITANLFDNERENIMSNTDSTNQTPEEMSSEAVAAVIRYAFLQGVSYAEWHIREVQGFLKDEAEETTAALLDRFPFLADLKISAEVEP